MYEKLRLNLLKEQMTVISYSLDAAGIHSPPHPYQTVINASPLHEEGFPSMALSSELKAVPSFAPSQACEGVKDEEKNRSAVKDTDPGGLCGRGGFGPAGRLQ